MQPERLLTMNPDMAEKSAAQPDRDRVERDEELAAPLPGARRLLAETLGTFALTGVAATAGVMGAVTGNDIQTLSKAVAPGLLVMAFIYAVGDASGAHFNPAVTLGFTLRGVFPSRWLPTYWLSQIVGAILAASMLRVLFGDAIDAGRTMPHVAPATAVAVEAFLTWLLLTVILGTADRFRIVGPNAALAVGGTIALCGLIAEPLTGASMNPARSIGPAVVSGNLTDLWVYIVGPVVGMLLAVLFTSLIHRAPQDDKPVEAATGDQA
ncbi:MAG: MIP/aquaporin family protein [Chloroflexota bacterium]|jgi:MIP family channel proteins